MKKFAVLSIALGTIKLSQAQSGLIEAPPGLSGGNYTPLYGGDFEPDNSLSYWGFQGGWAQGIVTRDPAAAYNGSWGMAMTRNATNIGYATGYMTNLVVGEQYVLSGFFKPKTVWQYGLVGIDVFTGGTQYEWMGINGLTSANEDKWYFAWTTFTVASPTVVVRVFNAVNDATQVVPDGALTYWDDIAITRASDFMPPSSVPEPSTMTLAALGIGAYLRKKRRQV